MFFIAQNWTLVGMFVVIRMLTKPNLFIDS